VTAIPDIMLSNGQNIPQFGFGVFQIKPEDTVAAVSTALQVGYRHIDTAEMYGNEKEVGEAISQSAWTAPMSSSPASCPTTLTSPMAPAGPSTNR